MNEKIRKQIELWIKEFSVDPDELFSIIEEEITELEYEMSLQHYEDAVGEVSTDFD